MRTTQALWWSHDVRSNAEGAFRLEKLTAGRYSISIQPEPESDLKAAPVTVDVIDQDITGLLIKTATGASLSGTVVIEGRRGPIPWSSKRRLGSLSI